MENTKKCAWKPVYFYEYDLNMLQHCLWLAKQETCQYVVEHRYLILFYDLRNRRMILQLWFIVQNLRYPHCKFIAPLLHTFVNPDKQVVLNVAYVMRHCLKQGHAAKNLAFLFYLLWLMLSVHVYGQKFWFQIVCIGADGLFVHKKSVFYCERAAIMNGDHDDAYRCICHDDMNWTLTVMQVELPCWEIHRASGIGTLTLLIQ
jgi:hypothetical protein